MNPVVPVVTDPVAHCLHAWDCRFQGLPISELSLSPAPPMLCRVVPKEGGNSYLGWHPDFGEGNGGGLEAFLCKHVISVMRRRLQARPTFEHPRHASMRIKPPPALCSQRTKRAHACKRGPRHTCAPRTKSALACANHAQASQARRRRGRRRRRPSSLWRSAGGRGTASASPRWGLTAWYSLLGLAAACVGQKTWAGQVQGVGELWP